MRRRLLICLSALALGLGLGPANALDPSLLDRLPPIVTSDNVEWLGQIPTATTTSSIAFDADEPIAYVSTFHGLQVYDITRPEQPVPIGALPLVGWQNESVDLAERYRDDGSVEAKSVLFAENTAAAVTDSVYGRRVNVVEVTDPTSPELVGTVETPTRTHTVTCVDPPACTYAYTDGRTQGEISIVDLTDFRNPRVAANPTYESVVALGHDQDVDGAGVVWHVGGQGSVALDVTDPQNPRQLNSTDPRGNTQDAGSQEWNRFIHHNSWRPNATAFTQARDEEGDLDFGAHPDWGPSGEPSIFSGNVLLVTEEYLLNSPDQCMVGEEEGALQTWYVPWLDADHYETVQNPDREPGGGSIEPLARWNTELLDTGMTLRQPGLCSAHYFDARDDGILAMGWYEQGLRILDVRDPLEIKQVGYFFTVDQETWHAHWVPEYGDDGQTGEPSDVVYTADNVRGIDILRVDLSRAMDPGTDFDLTAPILPQWLDASAAAASTPTRQWGWSCRLPAALG